MDARVDVRYLQNDVSLDVHVVGYVHGGTHVELDV